MDRIHKKSKTELNASIERSLKLMPEISNNGMLKISLALNPLPLDRWTDPPN